MEIGDAKNKSTKWRFLSTDREVLSMGLLEKKEVLYLTLIDNYNFLVLFNEICLGNSGK